MKKVLLLLIPVLTSAPCLVPQRTAAQVSYPYGVEPGTAVVELSPSRIAFKNSVLTAEWSIDAEKLSRGLFASTDTVAERVSLSDVFTIVFTDGKTLKSSAMVIVGQPRLRVEAISPPASAGGLIASTLSRSPRRAFRGQARIGSTDQRRAQSDRHLVR